MATNAGIDHPAAASSSSSTTGIPGGGSGGGSSSLSSSDGDSEQDGAGAGTSASRSGSGSASRRGERTAVSEPARASTSSLPSSNAADSASDAEAEARARREAVADANSVDAVLSNPGGGGGLGGATSHPAEANNTASVLMDIDIDPAMASEHAAEAMAVDQAAGASSSSSHQTLHQELQEQSQPPAPPHPPPEDTSNSSILSPTSTVCRGSYHQCGTARRVKVYELQNESWFDRGTGYCAGVYDELRDEALLVARREEACTLLARSGPSLSTTPVGAGGAQAGGADGGAGAGGISDGGGGGGGGGGESSRSGAEGGAGGILEQGIAQGQARNDTTADGVQGVDGSKEAGPTGSVPNNAAETSAAADASGSQADAPEGAQPSAQDTGADATGQAAGHPAGTTKSFDSEYVIVVSEDLNTDDVILKSRVLRDDVYQRQAETLVVWTEADGTDMALSFQEAEGCHELWEFLTEVQKHFILVDQRVGVGAGGPGGNEAYLLDPDGDDSPTDTPNPNSPTHALGFGPGSMEDLAQTLENFGLPEPQLGTLAQVESRLKDAASKGQPVRDRVAEWLLRENYIQKLLPVFQDAEDLEALSSLHLLCTIIQSILMLNDNAIFEHILQDDVFLGVVGMLEYDPEYPRSKASYREYLSDPSRYRQVVEIKDATIVRKIHQTYRLLYLKDVVLARVLDDPTFSILNSFVFYNQVDIVNYCVSNDGFLTELFGIFGPESKQPDSRKHEAVFFLQQLCAMGKQIQLPNRIALYRTLTEWGLLGVLEYALGQNDQTLRNAAAEVLMTIIEYDANSVRSHVLEQVTQETKPLFTVLADLLHTEQDLGLKTQMAEAVRVLLETNSDGPSAALAAAAAGQGGGASHGARGGANGSSADPDAFLTWLYDAEMAHLFSPLWDLPDFRLLRGGRQLDLVERSRAALCGHLCDLLSFTVLNHSFRSPYYLISSGVSKRVTSLLGARDKFVRLAAMRFFKTCLSSQNTFVNRHLAKIDLFGAVLDLVGAEADRDNLVSSSCLEFFDFIRRENITMVIQALMDTHAARVQTLAEHPIVGKTFAGLALQYHKNTEVPPPETSNKAQEAEEARRMRDLQRRAGNRAMMDAAEESYWNEDDEEEQDEIEVLPAAPVVGGTGPGTGKSLRRSKTRGSVSSISSAGSTSNAAKTNTTTTTTKLVDYDDDDGDDELASVSSSSGGTVGGSADGGSSAVSTASSSTTLAEAGASATAAAASSGEAAPEPTPSRLKRRRSQLGDTNQPDGTASTTTTTATKADTMTGAGGGGADEDTFDRLAKKTATVGKRRSAAAAGEDVLASVGVGGGGGVIDEDGAGSNGVGVGGGGASGPSFKRRRSAAGGTTPTPSTTASTTSTSEAMEQDKGERGEDGEEEEEDEEEGGLEGGFIRVERPTSPSAAKTNNAARALNPFAASGTGAGGGGGAGVGAGGGAPRGGATSSSSTSSSTSSSSSSRKITLALRSLGGAGKGGKAK